ncbi:Endonuclease/exonuclease/phosphatase superfamily [Arabidopsis suecica]|uniref:Endonuclease/exonuclease/phosphatase superfamily n=1 Tax=Arabidopsis suecica TaxID=45249 RepID=A0A8T2BDL7_ARASU|nr:Endonuclease/exonuclease/phosphatase superfamily [Arabidopsis suecica]
MDKALMAMSLEDEEEDLPFEMPNLPEFLSMERNAMSLVGRTLNPECQPMKNLIRNMPRKWQKPGKMRGIALSNEKFQFIFDNEHDLQEVLDKGTHTFNDWSLVVDRWYEHPPANYLQFFPIWVQLWNLPINFYTVPAITALGELIGEVKVVAFDPEKPQILEYIRIKVMFDVSRPLRRSKVVNLPQGGSTTVRFQYERIQKRCYECQRLTHEKEFCPILVKRRKDEAVARREGKSVPKPPKVNFLKESDPLFGVLNEDQVGIDPLTGRHRIAAEVLEGMRQYLLVNNNEDWVIKVDRIRKSVREVEKDPIAKKSILRLESPLLVHPDVNKDKGVVFGYGLSERLSQRLGPLDSGALQSSPHDLADADRSWLLESDSTMLPEVPGNFLALSQPFQDSATVFRSGIFDAGSSGTILKTTKQRKRPPKCIRKLKPKLAGGALIAQQVQKGLSVGVKEKRKAEDEGLGRSQDLVIPRLKELRKKHFPEILFLMETMHCKDKLVDLQVLLGYDGLHTVEPVGKCGGLALLWKSSIQMDILFEDKNLIDVQVQFGSSNFFLSCVYGDPDSSLRGIVWERLNRLGIGRRDRWCMVGDFNAILHNGEKLGGPRRADSLCKPFADMLDTCDMVEMSSVGNKFTWAGRRGDHWIQCRLDRAFGNKDWFVHFPASNQAFLDMRGSDHRPVLISLIASQDVYRGQFRFDKRFLHNREVKAAISKAWKPRNTSGGFIVSQRLRDCRKALSSWKKKNSMNALERIHQCEEALERVQSEMWPNLHQVHILKKELAKAYRNEEEYWRQKSRQKWLRSGNRNSKFFHGAVKGNRARKRIEKLKDVNGIMMKSEAAKGEVATDYFNNLFKSSNPQSFLDWFSGFPSKVTVDMNESLIAKVTAEEIREAVFSIKASSAPGPDGMSALFFQQYWDVVGLQVTKEILLFFDCGIFPSEWNFTHLCLLPKTHHPTEMSDLRPISLCSVLYKAISKILVSRLQPILPLIVSVNQSAFVSERLISDNILVAHEVVHSLSSHVDISSQFMAVKTDMSKAYDRVEWSYLRSLLIAMGFHLKWVEWIMICVSTVTFSVLINDQPFGMIKPQRGLRQGDPLSPFLFVLCTEGLTHLLNKGQNDGRLHGIKLSDEGPEVHHLLFADDSLFMCKASLDQCSFLQETLNRYGAATGQTINLSKSSITFGSKVNLVLKGLIQSKLGIVKEGGAGTYLGMPECFSGSKVEILSYIKDRLKAKLSGWYARFLSQGGKEVLLKSVALAMPVFVMSCFKLPKTTCDALSSAMADFWWNNAEHSGKIHWQSWEKLCLPKDLGGLGFRDIQTFNQALLAKQAWRILQYPDCLFAKMMKSRYFPTSDFLEAGLGSRPSYAWRSILFGRELLCQGLFKNVGNGKSFKVWIDEWIEDEEEGWRAPLRLNYFFNPDLRVSDLIDWRKRDWDPQKLSEHFFPADILRIKKIRPVTELEDFYSWKYNKSGDFSVKSAYWLASQSCNLQVRLQAEQRPSTNELKAKVWKLKTDPKIQVFLWKALNGSLPVAKAMKCRGMKVDERCQICGEDEESVNHVLFTCSYARQVWALSDIPSPQWGFQNGSVFANIHYLIENSSNPIWPEDLRNSFPWTLWRIWKNRNLLSIEGKWFTALESAQKVTEDVAEWFDSQKLNEDGVMAEQSEVVRRVSVRWKPPPVEWFKCNIGISWSNRNKLAGCAWVLRDHLGVVLLHSRRAFAMVSDKQEAHFKGLLWAIESMRSHRVEKVIFGLQDVALVKAINRPAAWPSYRFMSMEVSLALIAVNRWKILLENSVSNRGAFLIAKSVTNDGRLHSYVAVNHPAWLEGVFADERVSSSV